MKNTTRIYSLVLCLCCLSRGQAYMSHHSVDTTISNKSISLVHLLRKQLPVYKVRGLKFSEVNTPTWT